MTKNRIKVAYCLDSFEIGGTEINAVRTAESLDPSRFELVVFHLNASGPLCTRYEEIGVPTIHIEIPNLYSARTLRQGIRLTRYLREMNVNVVHSHDIYCNIFAVPLARLLTGCSIIASRRWGVGVSPEHLETANRISYRFAHRVLANSTTVANELVGIDHVPSKKVVSIPNFLEESAFDCDAETQREKQRQAWGVSAGCLLAGIVARLSPVKNHAVLFRAIAAVHKGIELVVVGDGPSRVDLETLADTLGIASRVHFVGEVTGKKNLHQYFDVSVLCSSGEGFPNSLIEAMAAARPIIATPVGGVVDAVSNGVNGIYVSQEDPSDIATALSTLDANPALRRKLGNTGRSIARNKFHQNRVIPMLSEFYESLAESGPD